MPFDPRKWHRDAEAVRQSGEKYSCTREQQADRDFEGEEIGRREAVPMRGKERLQRHGRATLRCRLDPVILEDRFDRVARDVVAETLEPTADARVAQFGFSFAMRTTSVAMSGLV